jgi:L-lactate dehydrogenase complex protein LldF
VTSTTTQFRQRAALAIEDERLQGALDTATDNFRRARDQAFAELPDAEALRDHFKALRQATLGHLAHHLETFETNARAAGAQVHWARDGTEACAAVVRIARRHGVKLAVKGKSMATEEIHLNHAMEEAGLRVVETDLGEYIIQLADEPPSHIVAPVIHKRLEDIAEIFQDKLDMPPTREPTKMTSLARARLRQEFFAAEMGISGCNFAIAETGTVCIVTNEGNGRMVSSMPRVYVAVMGIEKLVPTVEDAFLQLQALCRSATGQQLTVYCSMTSGPRREGDADGPEQVHVVLLDNGRSRMFARGYGEALMCIRCGACLNVCPVYQEIGGHAYGSTYNGPIGAVISPALAPEIAQFKELPHATSLCGACREVCPVKIDLPRLLLDLRSDLVQQGVGPKSEALGIKSYAGLMNSRRMYENLGKLASIGTNLYAGMSGGNIKFLPPPLNGWTAYRDFAPFARKSFREWWKERRKLRGQV